MTAALKLQRHITLTPQACFDLWTHPAEVGRWWGPKDQAGNPFMAEVEAWPATAGEPWAINMTAPDGRTFTQNGKLLELDRPRLVRFTFAWVEDGRRGPETEICVTFAADGRGTLMTFEQTGFADEATRDGHVQGWKECLDRLVALGADTVETRS